jgi:hypothetical protein
LEIDVEEGIVGAGLALPLDSEESLAADADFINEYLVYSALALRDGEGSWRYWRVSSRDTVAVVESIPSDAVARFTLCVVHCEGIASTAVPIDVIEP